HTVADSLSERARGSFDTGSKMRLRMARRFAVDLAKAFDLVQGNRGFIQNSAVEAHRLYACQVEERIKQHGGVPVGQDKAIAIGPDWISRIVAEKALPQTIGNRRQRHGRAGMA